MRTAPALAKSRVGSLTGTTGLDLQSTWFFSSKNLMNVSRTRFAGHSTTSDSTPGMLGGTDVVAREVNEAKEPTDNTRSLLRRQRLEGGEVRRGIGLQRILALRKNPQLIQRYLILFLYANSSQSAR
jgi:hypothetical protein